MNFSGIIAISGKNSKSVSRLLLSALDKAEVSSDKVSVVWGKLSEIEFSDNVSVALLALPDFNEYDLLDNIKNIERIIIPATQRTSITSSTAEKLSISTYAQESNYADFIAKNVTDREDFSHFELLSPNNIGRIHFDRNKYPKALEVLAVASAMLSLGVEFRKVIASFSKDK